MLIYALLSSKCHQSHLRAFVVKSAIVPVIVSITVPFKMWSNLKKWVKTLRSCFDRFDRIKLFLVKPVSYVRLQIGFVHCTTVRQCCLQPLVTKEIYRIDNGENQNMFRSFIHNSIYVLQAYGVFPGEGKKHLKGKKICCISNCSMLRQLRMKSVSGKTSRLVIMRWLVSSSLKLPPGWCSIPSRLSLIFSSSSCFPPSPSLLSLLLSPSLLLHLLSSFSFSPQSPPLLPLLLSSFSFASVSRSSSGSTRLNWFNP